MESKSVVMTSSFTGEAFVSVDGDVSDSDSWQVVDPSDSDDGDFSYGDVTTTDDDEDEVASDVDGLLQHPYGSPCSAISMQSLVDEISHHCQELKNANEDDHSDRKVDDVDDDIIVKNGGLIDGEADPYEEERAESDEDEDDEDLDDELVPKWLNHNDAGTEAIKWLKNN